MSISQLIETSLIPFCFTRSRFPQTWASTLMGFFGAIGSSSPYRPRRELPTSNLPTLAFLSPDKINCSYGCSLLVKASERQRSFLPRCFGSTFLLLVAPALLLLFLLDSSQLCFSFFAVSHLRLRA